MRVRDLSLWRTGPAGFEHGPATHRRICACRLLALAVAVAARVPTPYSSRRPAAVRAHMASERSKQRAGVFSFWYNGSGPIKKTGPSSRCPDLCETRFVFYCENERQSLLLQISNRGSNLRDAPRRPGERGCRVTADVSPPPSLPPSLPSNCTLPYKIINSFFDNCSKCIRKEEKLHFFLSCGAT